MTDGTLIPLNRSEHLYWAAEGYLGAINQPYVLRLDHAVDQTLVRQALRELTSAFPRMRGVIEPTLTTYKLRILPDDFHVDQLFDDAYRVQRGVDSSSRDDLQTLQNELANESISLERGLPWRARFIAHPQQPALFFSVHHIVGDGRSMVQMLSAIIARLNGQAIAPCPLQSSSMGPAVKPLQWWQWPASIVAWWRSTRRDAQASKGTEVITLASKVSPHFTTVGVYQHPLPGNYAQLRAVAKQMGTTVNTLMMVVVANAFLSRAANNPKAVAAIRISVDLRRYFPEGQQPEFGNFVATFTVIAKHQATLAEQIKSIEAQVKDHMGRFERHERALPLTAYEWLPLVGRTLFSHLLLKSKAKGAISCHFSNLGSLDTINQPQAKVRLAELWPATITAGLVFGLNSINGGLVWSSIYQQDEIERNSVMQLLASIDKELNRLTAQPAA